MRRRSTPSVQVVHVVEECPDCHTRLAGGWGKRRREVLEIELAPVRVVEHQYWERQCPLCSA